MRRERRKKTEGKEKKVGAAASALYVQGLPNGHYDHPLKKERYPGNCG